MSIKNIDNVAHENLLPITAEYKQVLMGVALELRDKYGLYGLNMPVGRLQTRLEDVAFLKGKGLWISLWFVQNADMAERYRSSGADAFVTDCISKVR